MDMGVGCGSFDESNNTFCGSYDDIDEMLYGKDRDANYGYWDFYDYINAHVYDNDRFGTMVFADQYSYENYLQGLTAGRAACGKKQQWEQEGLNAVDSAQRIIPKNKRTYLYEVGDKLTLYDEGRYDRRLQFGRVVKIKMFGRRGSGANDSAALVIRLTDKRVVFGFIGACYYCYERRFPWLPYFNYQDAQKMLEEYGGLRLEEKEKFREVSKVSLTVEE